MLYLLYGPDTYRSTLRRNEIVARATAVHGASCVVKRIDCEDEGISAIVQEFETPSLFAPKRFVVATHAEAIKDYAALEAAIARFDLSLSRDAILLLQGAAFTLDHPLVSLASRLGRAQRFDFFALHALEKWTSAFFASRRTQIESQALRTFVERVGSDLWRMHNECEKLIAWSGEGDRRVDTAAIEALVAPSLEGTAFPFVDAFLGRNTKRAFAELERIVQMGEDEAGVFALLTKQVCQLADLFALAQKNRAKVPANAAALLKVHPFVVSKLTSHCARWREEDLGRLIAALFAHDVSVKTGQEEPRLALTMLAASL